jgi:hypothetical protein
MISPGRLVTTAWGLAWLRLQRAKCSMEGLLDPVHHGPFALLLIAVFGSLDMKAMLGPGERWLLLSAKAMC